MGKKKNSIEIDIDQDMMDLALKYSKDQLKYLIEVGDIKKFVLTKGLEKIVIKVEDENVFSYKKVIRTYYLYDFDDIVEMNIKHHRWARPVSQFLYSCIVSPTFRQRYEYSAEEFDNRQKKDKYENEE